MKLLLLLILLIPCGALAQEGESFATQSLTMFWTQFTESPFGANHYFQIRSHPSSTGPLLSTPECLDESPNGVEQIWIQKRMIHVNDNNINPPVTTGSPFAGTLFTGSSRCIYVDLTPGNADLNNDSVVGGPDFPLLASPPPVGAWGTSGWNPICPPTDDGCPGSP